MAIKKNLKKKISRIFLEWHPVLNGKIIPENVPLATKKKFWWRCGKKRCGHNWKDTIYSRVNLNRTCPRCLEKKTNKAESEIKKIQDAINKFDLLQQQIDKHMEMLFNDELRKWARIRSFVIVRRNINTINKMGLSLRKTILDCRKKMAKKRKK